MDKNAIKKYAVWARRELIERVSQRAMFYGVTSQSIGDPNATEVNGRLLSPVEKKQRQALIRNVREKGFDQVMEEVAYTWFNRFAALRFMEVNGYLPSLVRVFTNEAGAFKPQILSEALHLDLEGLNKQKVLELESGNKTEELFRYLLIVQCNALYSILPGMFQRIEDYTELLLPDNLLRDGSVIEQLVSCIPEEDWTDQVQIIGWLYQYYISDLNEIVYNGSYAKTKIPKELIPAATTIYTPDWPVHYMVENSLGRLWLDGHPDEILKSSWKYDELVQKERDLKLSKDELVGKRNDLDSLEQKFCDIRDVVGTCLFEIDEKDFGQVGKSAEAFVSAYRRSKKENNGFFARLFWSSVEPKRLAELDGAIKNYNNYANHYGLIQVNQQSGENLKDITDSAERFEKAMPLAVEYRKALSYAHEPITLETIDQDLLSIKRSRADIAQKLWDKWLRTRHAEFTAEERRNMSNFVASMKLTKDADLADQPELRKQYSQMIQIMTRYLQCWAVTSLSAKSRIPFEPGVFDYVIIDEASQCDIASIIPLLFRAKRAVIIGDPKQLQHISQLTSKQDLALIQKYGIDPMWSYSANSLYAIAAAKVKPENMIQLRDHFRSCAEIIEYSNETFYDGSLRTATPYNRLKVPAGEKPGIRWIDVAGKTIRPNTGSAFNQEEIDQVVKELHRLVHCGYAGTLGVTTPFHLQAEKIMLSLEKEPELLSNLVHKHDFLADTVHKFQGDERDIMLFSSVVTNSAPAGTVGFLERTGNLFNVAVTRARSMLIVVGDYRYCAGCKIGYLNKFAAYYDKLAKGGISKARGVYEKYTREYPMIPNSPTVSEWEKRLYTALFDAGVKIVPQYPADRYSLDLALILPNGRKLDIEVDGEMYHRSWNKELSYRDQLRNQRMFELGWDVKRFWVYQVRDELDWCVSEVKKWYEKCS